VVDTAAHVATVAALHNSCLPGGSLSLDGPDLAYRVQMTTVDTVSALNDYAMGHFTERDRHVLVDRLRSEVGRLLELSDGVDPDSAVPWLGESRVPVAGILAHILNELSIHGHDIARATRSPWTIPPQDAATFLEYFLVGVIRHGYGRLLDRDEPPRPGRIAVRFQSRYTTPVTLALTDGIVSLAAEADPFDVRVTFDPTVLNLMMFGRVSKARAVLAGKVVVTGRRPWRLPAFLQTLRMPS